MPTSTGMDQRDSFGAAGISQVDEVSLLLAGLYANGITFLTGSQDAVQSIALAEHQLAPHELLARLASSTEPSVRDATIALLLLHPELAIHLPTTMAPLSAADEQLAVLALAAAYLQRQWRARLALAIGPRPPVVVGYWRDWKLPDPDIAAQEGIRELAV